MRGARDEVEALRGRAAELELGSADQVQCAQDLAATRAELARYQAGLQRAVDQLNEQQRAAAAAAQVRARLDAAGARPTPAPAPAPRRDGGHIASRIGPYVQILGSQIVATGELWSYRAEPTTVRLQLSLYEDDYLVREELTEVLVPPHTSTSYRHVFARSATPGDVYTVQVRPEW